MKNTLGFEFSDIKWKAEKIISGDLHVKNTCRVTHGYPGHSQIILIVNSNYCVVLYPWRVSINIHLLFLFIYLKVWALKVESFLGPEVARAIWAQKNQDLGPNPSNAQEMDLPASNTLRTGPYNDHVH